MEAKYRVFVSYDQITISFVVVLLIVWGIKMAYHKRLVEFLQLPFSNKYIAMILREKNLESYFTIFMLSLQVIGISILLWYLNITYGPFSILDYTAIEYWMILVAVLLFMICKITLQLMVAWLFKMESVTNQYLYTKINYLNYSSLVLMVGLLFGVYSKGASQIVVFSTLILIALLNLNGVLGMVKNNQKLIRNSFFYIILYLCAFEIAPILIIGGYIKN